MTEARVDDVAQDVRLDASRNGSAAPSGPCNRMPATVATKVAVHPAQAIRAVRRNRLAGPRTRAQNATAPSRSAIPPNSTPRSMPNSAPTAWSLLSLQRSLVCSAATCGLIASAAVPTWNTDAPCTG